MFRASAVSFAAVLALSVGACDKKAPTSPPKPTTTTAAPAPALPANLFLTAAPADAKDVKDAKAAAKTGDTVVLTGRIGGSKEPFVPGRALFTLVDGHLPACGETSKEDDCETPWDFCCEPRDTMTANTATVQVVGPEGQPLKTSLENVQGLKKLAKVTIVGKVAKAEPGNLLIEATGIYVTQ